MRRFYSFLLLLVLSCGAARATGYYALGDCYPTAQRAAEALAGHFPIVSANNAFLSIESYQVSGANIDYIFDQPSNVSNGTLPWTGTMFRYSSRVVLTPCDDTTRMLTDSETVQNVLFYGGLVLLFGIGMFVGRQR